MKWYVLYTKSRNEKIVNKGLNEIGMEAYCPVLLKEKQWSDRKKIVEEPLFSSYVFVRCTDIERYKAFELPGAVRYLYWLQKPAIVRDEEIDAIKAMLNDFDHNEIQMESISLNDTVILQSGPLMDRVGTVTGVSGNKYEVVLKDIQMRIFVDATKNKLSHFNC